MFVCDMDGTRSSEDSRKGGGPVETSTVMLLAQRLVGGAPNSEPLERCCLRESSDYLSRPVLSACSQRSIDSMGTRDVAECSTLLKALSLSDVADSKRIQKS